ncbi:dipeptidyl-peptidase 5 [Filimonas sp.]|nr:dipeptidyl-peptidase 5 [Filimonas sp.]
MRRIVSFAFVCLVSSTFTQAQSLLTPETLLSLGRVGAKGLSKDGSLFYFSVATPSIEENKNKSKFYSMPAFGGKATEISAFPVDEMITVEKEGDNIKVSPDGKHVLFTREVKLQQIQGYDRYPALTKSNAQIYDNLNQRHWDTWEDGSYSHVFLADNVAGFALREKTSCRMNCLIVHKSRMVAMKTSFFRPMVIRYYMSPRRNRERNMPSAPTQIFMFMISLRAIPPI